MLLQEESSRVAIKSGHGTGKSCLASILILWFMCCFPYSQCLVTAPSASQLYVVMGKELRLWYTNSILKLLDLFEFTKEQVRFNDKVYGGIWFTKLASVANPENISGVHADDVLIVVDEAAGVDDEIFVRLEGIATTNARTLFIGNPSWTHGHFYEIFNNPSFSSKYDTLTFSCVDSDNVNTEWVEEMKDKYGEDSPIYKIRVLGEFASIHESTIISRDAINDAINRDVEKIPSNTLHIGIDVSSGTGQDKSVICIREGNYEIQRILFTEQIAALRDKIFQIVKTFRDAYDFIHLKIDTTGLGIQLGQEVEAMYELDKKVKVDCINFSFRATNQQLYSNVFTEMIFNFKDILNSVRLLNVRDSDIDMELGTRTFETDSLNRFIAEKKRIFIKKIGHSPDEGDAVLLAFYEPQNQDVVLDRLSIDMRR